MAEVEADRFVVEAGWLRVLLLGLILIGGSIVFLGLALVILVAGVQNGVVGLVIGVPAAALTLAFAIYFLFALATMRSRIEVADDGVRLRLNRQRGLLPLPVFDHAVIPYSEIAAVERREEFYAVFGMTTQLDAYSLVTRDGRRYRLGSVSPQGAYNLPYAEAAELIARRAGMPVTDRGGVRAGGLIRTFREGLPAWGEDSMSAGEVVHARSRAALVWQISFALVALAIAVRACVPSD